MLKVYLVEDEIAIRESIRETLDWAAAGFDYLGDAPDGEIAFKAIRKLRPDIVITDIKMPFVDGLELTRLIREELPEVRIVILSGHDDFAYAQKAIRLGVVEYLVKPVSPAELMQAVNRVAVRLREEIASRAASGESDAGVWKRRRDAFLLDLLAGRIAPSDILSGAADLGVRLDDNYFVAAALRAGKPSFSLADDANLTGVLARETAASDGWWVERGKGVYAAVFQAPDAAGAEAAGLSALEQTIAECRETFGLRFHGGVGAATERAHGLKTSMEEADAAANFAAFSRAAGPVSIREVRGGSRDLGVGLSEKLDQSFLFLQCGGMGEAKTFAQEVAKAAIEAGGGIAWHYAYIDFLLTAAKVVGAMNGDPGEVLPELERMGEETFSIDSPAKLETAVRGIAERVISLRKHRHANRYGETLARAKRFIDGHYGDPDLSLQRAAQHVHMSPTHFSTVFSRETGETFIECLSRVRVENAMRLLRATALSAAEIAERVGYKDPQYFSRAFKRSTGVSIRSFRSKS